MPQFTLISEAQRTPADLKWLLNERAAIAGALKKTGTRCQYLDQTLAKAERRYHEAVKKHEDAASRLRAELSRQQAVLQALDQTISLAYKEVRCDAGGVVAAWAGRYGERGAMAGFIHELLNQTASDCHSVRDIMNACVFRFGLTLHTPADRLSLKYTVSGTLYALKKRGLAEKVTSNGPGHPSYWRAANRVCISSLRRQASKMLEVPGRELSNAS